MSSFTTISCAGEPKTGQPTGPPSATPLSTSSEQFRKRPASTSNAKPPPGTKIIFSTPSQQVTSDLQAIALTSYSFRFNQINPVGEGLPKNHRLFSALGARATG